MSGAGVSFGVGAALGLALLLGVTWVAAAADFGPLEQPPHVPRQVVLLSSPRLYAGAVDAEAPALFRGLSPRGLAETLRQAFRGDARFVLAEEDLTALLAARQKGMTERSLEAVVRQSVRLGIDHYRVGQLAAAAENMQSALQTAERTALRWEEPQLLAEAWWYLALTHLSLWEETNGQVAEERARHQVTARHALRELWRIDPTRRVSADLYPLSVVQIWEEAVQEVLVEQGRGLRLRMDEAAWLAEALGVQTLVYAFVVGDGVRLWSTLQVYDHAGRRFALEETEAVESTQRSVERSLDAAISRALCCLPPVSPPAPIGRQLPEWVYLTVGYSAGLWLESPARRLFPLHGVVASASTPLTQDLSLFAQGGVEVSGQDPDGDLLQRIVSVRSAAGIGYIYRIRRVRLQLQTGLELMRTSEVRATRDFWCKLSGGRAFDFGDGRRCDPSAVTSAPGRWVAGVTLQPAFAWQIAGPFWLHVQLRSSLYAFPLDTTRAVDFPFGLEVGVGYQR